MNFGTIEIICKPCQKCRKAEQVIQTAIRLLETENQSKYTYSFKRTTDLRQGQRYSANIAKAPLVIINGSLVFAGNIRDVDAVKTTLLSIMRSDQTKF